MKVLIACEFSGVVRDAFLEKGHDAISCDLLPTESNGPHYTGDVFDLIGRYTFDLMIAHPPCTFLSAAGARWLYQKGQINEDRLKQGIAARLFFERLLLAPIKRIAIENPTPMKVFQLEEPSQVIQPYFFGEPYSKRTCLWLKNLEPLTPTNVIEDYKPFLPSNTGGKKRGQKHQTGGAAGQKDRSRTFKGIASAMAEQWGENA